MFKIIHVFTNRQLHNNSENLQSNKVNHKFPFETAQQEKMDCTFSVVLFHLEIFQWTELKYYVPITSQSEFPELIL